MTLRALAVGHVTLDRYGDSHLPGGSVLYAACAWRALGAGTRLVSSAGPDFPQGVLTGIGHHVSVAAATTVFENIHAPGAPRVQYVTTLAPSLSPELLSAAWKENDMVFLAPVFAELDVEGWIDAAEAPIVGLGLQGCLKRTVKPPHGQPARVVPAPCAVAQDALKRLRAVFLSTEDLAEQPGLLEHLRRTVRIVALTRGREGSDIYVAGTHAARVGVHPATELDPTGAGDVFAAAMLLGLARGEAPVQAARLGAAAASIVIEGVAGGSLARVREAEARRAGVPWRDGPSGRYSVLPPQVSGSPTSSPRTSKLPSLSSNE